MAICKFNIGDKVRRINHHNNYGDSKFEVGQVGKIVKIRDNTFVDVKVNGTVNEWNDVKNLELVEKATLKYKVGDRVVIGNSNVGVKWAGEVGVIVEIDSNYDYPYCVSGTSYGDRLWCKVTGYASKFKVGDMVIGNDPDRYGITKKGWIGKVTDVKESSIRVYGKGIDCEMNFWVDPKYFDLYSENKTEEKIVITHDGKTTTATLYREDGSKVKATARCAPEDTFDFNVGAKLAMERLMEKVETVEWRVVDRKPVPGDYFRLKRVDYPEFDNLGDILKADGVKGDMIYVLEKNHPHCKSKTSNFHWNYTRSEYEVVEKVTADEPKKPEPPTPKYWTGRAVCVDNCKGDTDFIVGKIYNIDNGKFTDENGKVRPVSNERVVNPEDLTKGEYWKQWAVKFIPIVEDENKPLTTEEIRKMDGQKVYVIRLDENGCETPDHSFSGWHTVNVKDGRLTDSEGLHWDIDSNNEALGYHAYRAKPTDTTK